MYYLIILDNSVKSWPYEAKSKAVFLPEILGENLFLSSPHLRGCPQFLACSYTTPTSVFIDILPSLTLTHLLSSHKDPYDYIRLVR